MIVGCKEIEQWITTLEGIPDCRWQHGPSCITAVPSAALWGRERWWCCPL